MTIIEPKQSSDQLLYSTIRMVIENQNHEMNYGTGFLFSFNQNKASTYIITNRHVVENGVRAHFTLHEGIFIDNEIKPTGSFSSVELDNLKKYCKYHPDSGIDLCAIPINPIDKLFDENKKHFFARHLGPEMIISDENLKSLGAIEDVLMAGYPLGLWDDANNFPLIRKGITSSHPATDFCGMSRIVIDIATFPGSSGSPVMIINDGVYMRGSSIIPGGRAILLGILSARAIFSSLGEVKIQSIPSRIVPISEDNIPTHLGYAIKAREILKMELI